ncbi:MAG: ABC transporter substrate-binding protein [Chloroflexi bacterium]|nr:ABC transporter substrate-binding protein [Chloroflexota bacterium]
MTSKARLSLGATLLAGATLVASACGGAAAPTATPAAPGPAATAPATTARSATATSAPAAVKLGGTLRLGTGSNPGMLDAHASRGGHEIEFIRALYDNLVDRDNDMVPRPATSLAESWELVDPKTIVFRIRRGVKNHDDTPLNAGLVKWNMERVLDPATQAAEGGFVRPYVVSIDVVDEYSVRFNLNQPSASLLPLLGDRVGMIMSRAAVEKYGKDIRRNPVATGPFRFVEWVPDTRIVLEKNRDYWQKGLPYLDRLEWRIIPDPTVRLATLVSGELDAQIGLDAKDVAQVKQNPKLRIERFVGASAGYIYGNYALPPWNNVNFRRAVAWAIDRQAIVEGLYFGEGMPAKGPVLPAFGWAYDPKLEAPSRDVAKAKQYLKASGLGDRVEFTLSIHTGPVAARQAEVIKDQLSEVGIIANLRTYETAAWVEAFQRDEIVVMVSGIVLRGDPDAAMGMVFHSDAFFSPGGKRLIAKNDPTQVKLDQLISEAKATYDLKARRAKYDEIQRFILDNAYGVFTFYTTGLDVTYTHVKAWDFGSEGNRRWARVWLDK